jgi:two-component system CitB family response regulator
MTDNEQRVRVVIAEDDHKNAEIQQRFLERMPQVELVGVAHTLQEAEEIVGVFHPDLILLDVHFPEGSGLTLLKSLRMANEATDVILITAAQEVATLTTAMRNGVFDYILKPVNFSRLESSIQKYIDYQSKLSAMGLVAQSNVDDLLHSNKTDATAQVRLPKGIDALTLDAVRQVFMPSSDAMSVEDVGVVIGASRTTARRYLEYLVSTRELEAKVRYGTVGRPERHYKSVR